MALGIRWAQTGSAGAWVALTTDPLLWIIVTAPLFLGVFAALGGHQHDGLRGLTAELEDRVKERTADLVSAVDRLRLITDNVADGLLTIDLDGRLVGPASAQAVRWFGEPTDRSGLAEWLKADDPTFGDLLAMGLDQIREDILPVELTLEQLPRQFQSGDRQYEFDARVIPGGRELLLVIRDATDRLALARERAASEERHAVIAQMLRDPGGFQLFRTDCEHLLEEARETDSEATCKKALHTLKGNSAVYGFCRLASVCHQIEDELQDSGAPLLDEEQGKRLQETYADSIQQVAAFLPDEADVVRVSREELLRLADSGGVSEHIRKTLERWTHEPLQPILDRLVSHGERVAERLGKQVDFVAEAGDARVNLDAHGEFIAQLCHVVRNAIDHGVESPDARHAANKPKRATVRLQATDSVEGTLLSVADDGRGIDWEQIAEKAKRLGLPAATAEQRLAALLCDGFSTSDSVSDISGRGVGLGSVWTSAKSLGIHPSLETRIGQGTRMLFLMPHEPPSATRIRAAS
ncbi:MAG: Hpt domain-containing protein [Myxococcales bacterium]|nr:Hpt domain-containing protein [Myxococcales bacterium]